MKYNKQNYIERLKEKTRTRLQKEQKKFSNPLEAYPKETHAIYLAYLS
jgi:hypothetical protein